MMNSSQPVEQGLPRLSTQHAAFAFIVQMTGVASGYVMHVGLARWMGAASYGTYSYVMTWAGVLSMAAGLGLPVCSVRFISEYRAGGQLQLLRGAIARFRQLALAAGVLVAVSGTIAAGFVASRTRGWLILAVWSIPFATLLN